MTPLTPTQVQTEIEEAERAMNLLGDRECRLWDRLKISPVQWDHQQYPEVRQFWVVALSGNRCLYFNHVEGGWGWGGFDTWGTISRYHWQQDEIQHVIHQTIFAIDHG